mgnify:FL=1
MNDLIRAAFKKRGLSDDEYLHFFDDSHAMLKDLDVLCEALKSARDEDKVITILPDFDMDGIMSGVIGYTAMNLLGFRVNLYPSDPKYGYGFDEAVVSDLLTLYPDTDILLTCDTGITCFSGIDYANSKGLRVFVTDHHKESSQKGLPAAEIVVDPCRADETYEHTICGAHVFYQLFNEFALRYHEKDTELRFRLKTLSVFAGIATISDTMPVLYENRSLLRESLILTNVLASDMKEFFFGSGIEFYDNLFRNCSEMLRHYLEAGKFPKDGSLITESFYGYYFAPLFNALKRMHTSTALAYNAFFGNEAVSKSAFTHICELKEECKAETEKHWTILFDDYMSGRAKYAPYLFVSEGDYGILGLLATRMTEITGVPCIVVKEENGSYKGSGRSPEWFPCLTTLSTAGFYVGGHEGAFGVGFDSPRSLKAAYLLLSAKVEETLALIPAGDLSFEPEILLDFSDYGFIRKALLFDDLCGFIYEMRSLGPYGRGFPEFSIRVKFKTLGDMDFIGDGSHVKCAIAPSVDFLVFNIDEPDVWDEVSKGDIIEADAKLDINVFRGRVSVSVMASGNIWVNGTKIK